ncbi:MAG: ferrous iron transport protein A [Gammaproteobacteria bacterium]
MKTAAMTTSLLAITQGNRARIAEIQGDRQQLRRMLSLGLRVGSVIDVLSQRGRGVVVSNQGSRVALGSSIARNLFVEPIE